jgi:hypothetical protein
VNVSEKFYDIAGKINVSNWIQGHYASAADGTMVGVEDENAVAFCLEGWLIKERFDGGLRLLNLLLPTGNAVAWNDDENRTVDEVYDLLVRAGDAARFVEVQNDFVKENENA